MSMTMREFFNKFPDEKACEDFFIEVRWGDRAHITCPHCGCKKIYHTSHRVPFKCSHKDCRKRFNVKTDSVLMESKISLQQWLLAIYLIGTSKKGMSSVELSEKVGITQKTAWFLGYRIGYRIREACMDFASMLGGSIEMDETFIGDKEENKHAKR